MMKILEALWFSGFTGTVGIVAIESDITKERKFYIGVGDGVDETMDTLGIATYGMPFSPDEVIRFINQHKNKEINDGTNH